MKPMFKQLPSPAMIVACASLVVALGGVSYAAGVLPKNSVGTAQLQTKAVTGAKLKKNAVTSPKVKDGTLLAADFKAGQLATGTRGPKGDTGLQGPKGDAGRKGDKGDPGATNVTERHGPIGPAAGPGAYSVGYVDCQAGETITGGGAGVTSDGTSKPTLTASAPNTTGWAAVYRNDGAGGTVEAGAYVLCASP